MISGNDEIKIRYLWDYFPKMYHEEKAAADEYRQREELEQYKECKRRYAAEHNRRLAAEHGTAE